MAATKAERLRQEALNLLEKANELEENYIEEPQGCEDGTNVIYFKKQFKPHDRYYVYSAVQVASSRLWYVSGNLMSRNAYSWDSLVEWIQLGSDWEIWFCDSFSQLASSKS